MNAATMRGSCLCGTLQFEATGPLIAMLHCHCSRCRKSHGAPFATFATLPRGNLRWISGEDAVCSFAAAPGGQRRFCAHCGSPAPGTIESTDIAFFAVGQLDHDPGLRPQGHLFVGSKAPWHEIADSLPRYDRYPPEFGDATSLPDPAPVEVTPGCLAGGCLCGDVAFEFRNPVAMFQCHCGRCRKSRGAAHGANLFCKAADFRWTRGEAQVVDYKLPQARFYGVSFCRQCGASVPHASRERGIVIVPAGTLDSDPGIRPAAHIYVGSKAPWFDIADSLHRYEDGPPSFPASPPHSR